jgi:hypothetical protein
LSAGTSGGAIYTTNTGISTIQIDRSSFSVLTAGTHAGLGYFSGSELTMTSTSLTAWNLVASTGSGGVLHFINSISASVTLIQSSISICKA